MGSDWGMVGCQLSMYIGKWWKMMGSEGCEKRIVGAWELMEGVEITAFLLMCPLSRYAHFDTSRQCRLFRDEDYQPPQATQDITEEYNVEDQDVIDILLHPKCPKCQIVSDSNLFIISGKCMQSLLSFYSFSEQKLNSNV